MDPEPPHLRDLIARIADGDRAAMEGLYDATAPRLLGLARTIVSDPEAAEEVLGDTLVQVWRSAHRFDPARSEVWTWLFMITRSRALDRRRQSRRREQPLEEHDGLPSLLADDRSEDYREERVRVALKELPTSQSTPILLAYFRGYTYADTASLLDLPEGTVKSRIRAGFKTLRHELQGSDSDDRHAQSLEP